MQAMLVAAVTTVIGVIGAFWAARNYYGRSHKHRLAVYYLPTVSNVIGGVDSDMRKDLSISFRGETVLDLSLFEILVANEGVSAIRSPLQPLTITIKENARIFDVALMQVSPEGRYVAIERISDRTFRCIFELLNSQEYFYLKVITSQYLSEEDIATFIVAEDLPPQLDVLKSSVSNVGSEPQELTIIQL